MPSINPNSRPYKIQCLLLWHRVEPLTHHQMICHLENLINAIQMSASFCQDCAVFLEVFFVKAPNRHLHVRASDAGVVQVAPAVCAETPLLAWSSFVGLQRRFRGKFNGWLEAGMEAEKKRPCYLSAVFTLTCSNLVQRLAFCYCKVKQASNRTQSSQSWSSGNVTV